jgi:hypothetical protein
VTLRDFSIWQHAILTGLSATGQKQTSPSSGRCQNLNLSNHACHMVNSLKLLVSAAVTCAVSSPCMASASTFRLVPDVAFEHRSYESGGEDYVARVYGNEIVYRPGDRTLVINRSEIHLDEGTYALLDDADLSEASIYTAAADKSRICIEFGFGGLLRSGSFQGIKGILVVQTRNRAESVVHSEKGVNVRCGKVGINGRVQHR